VLPALPPEPGLDRRELARRAELAIASVAGVPAASAVTHVRAAEEVPAAASTSRSAAPRPADVSAAA
jgi:hypothetical protein